MLKRFVNKKHLILYFFSIAITWLEAIITPALVQNIVASFTQSRARHSLESFDFRNPWKSHPLTRFGWETLLLRSFDY